MSKIHPTAVIEDGAEIGEDCEIGAYSFIGKNVKLGNGCKLHSHVVLDGWSTFGDKNEFFSFACLGKQSQDLKYEGNPSYVKVGSNNIFREYVTVNAAIDHQSTVIGDNNFFLSYSHIAHDCQLGSHIIISSNSMLAGHVEVEDYVIISGFSGAVQFARLGRGSFIGGYSKVTKDVLPYSISDGMPAELRTINKIGMERRGSTPETISAVNKAFKLLARSNLTIEQAIEEIRKTLKDVPEALAMADFAENSKTGIARPKKRD